MRNAKKEIVQLIQSTSGKWSPYQIFSDWVECMALSIQNSCCILPSMKGKIWKKREQQYADIMKKYEPKERDAFADMTALLMQAMRLEITDMLGEIYMESECANKNTGQFFTPFSSSKMCACLTVPANYDGSEKLRIHEPSCGAGGMILASAAVLRERGINYQKCMQVVAQDLDWKAVYMTYVQLSLYGIDAVVVQGDTLADPYHTHYPPERTFRTPKNMGVLM